jgi:hypothetical protein
MSSDDYIRICPVCAAEHPPEATQCRACGTLLLGVDLTLRAAAPSAAAVAPSPEPPPAAATTSAPAENRCPHADCAAANPPGLAECLYCGRPMQPAAAAEPSAATVTAPATASLYNLPAALAANFTIDRVLPAGGAEAELMLMRGIKTGARVIAKLYRPGIMPKGEVLERVGRVAHAHVVRLLTHGFSDGIAYEVMEYCAGGSLRDLLAVGAMPPERARRVLAEVAEALAALHECQVIHRDLKPENVLVRTLEPLDLVLTDFGISSVQAATQLFTGQARTARYSAPEAMTGVLDAAADYWSLGMIVLEALQGRHPFADISDAVIAHRLTVGVVDTSAVRDRQWQKLCRGLLQRDPGQRWRIAEVRRWLAGDASLPEPAAPTAVLVAPYLIEGEECRSVGELAIAFSRHWQAARKDYRRGELESWVRRELKDHDLIRLLHDVRERGGTEDMQLFRLIRRLAPTIPPIWLGDGLDVRTLLAKAAQVQGDGSAAEWLNSVHAERVIDELAESDYPDLRQLSADWTRVGRIFAEIWRAAGTALENWRRQERSRGDVVVDIDALMYGIDSELQSPAAGVVHAELLLLLRVPAAMAAQGPLLFAEATRLAAYSPWLAELLQRAEQVGEAGAVAMLAIKHLLPQAQQASEVGQRRVGVGSREREESPGERDGRLRELLSEAGRQLTEIRALAMDLSLLGTSARARLAAALDAFLAVSLQVRGFVDDNADDVALRSVAVAEPLVLAIRDRLDEWESSARITQLWRNQHLQQAAAIAIFLLLALAPQWLPLLILPPALFALWRSWIVAHHRSGIRQLAARLPLRLARAADA